ncbi:hypothetical protein BG003_000549 [Podila horticola]|nr:hypothetical protein BG003_000549 [Podila horticola]
MHKSLIFLVVLCVPMAASAYCIEFANNSGSKKWKGCYDERICYCVANVQTGTIRGIDGGNIKLFSNSDCTGNYDILGSNGQVSNTQWVNSISFGRSGISSVGPWGCPDWYA